MDTIKQPHIMPHLQIYRKHLALCLQLPHKKMTQLILQRTALPTYLSRQKKKKKKVKQRRKERKKIQI